MRPFKFTARVLAIVAVGLLIVSSSSISSDVLAETVDEFEDGKSTVTLTLTGPGQNAESYIRVPAWGTVTAATFDVTGTADASGGYPHFVTVHVGSLGQQVYGWTEREYGHMGQQILFSDMQGSHQMLFKDAGSNDTLSVLLPEGAKVTDAQVRVTGAEYDAGWDYPLKLSHKKGNNYVAISVGYKATPQLLDYDGDGDLDMLSGGYGGMNNWIWYFENIGTKTTPVWQEDPSKVNIRAQWPTYYMSSPTFVDLDDDGDWDLVVGEYYGNLRVYWNTGSNANPVWDDNGTGEDSVFYGIGDDVGYYASTDFADMDNDGDLDLAVGEYSGGGSSNVGITAYRNDYRNGVYSWSTANFFGGIDTDSYSNPDLVDYDGDGDQDIFVGYQNGTFGYYENTGTKASPKWTHRPGVQGDIDIGGYAGPTIGDLNNDGDLDLVVGSYDGNLYYYKRINSAPLNPSIDIGADGDSDWSYQGELTTSATATGLAAEFESHLTGTPVKTDAWGNRFHAVKVKVTSSSPGYITLDQLKVTYTYDATTTDFTAYLNDYIKDHKDEVDDQGYLKVPIIVTSRVRGAVKLSNLKVDLDMPPVWGEIPSTYTIDEDTKVDRLIDLWQYVTDDYTTDEKLTLKLVQDSAVGIVTVTLVDGRYVGVDAETGEANDNWNGDVSVRAFAWDGLDHVAESNVFVIKVLPVNDPPVLGGTPPTKIMEDETLTYQIEASDVDGDVLKFSVDGAPADMTVSETGLVTWTPTNDDVGVYTLMISVTDPSGETATLTWILEVVNVNDAPEIEEIAPITITEGKPYLLSLSGRYCDVDNEVDELALSIDNAFSELDAGTKVVTIFYPKETGIVQDKLVITVTDPEGLSVTSVVMLKILQVEKLALLGIPDQHGVEEDTWVLDIKPYLYNVEDFNKLTVGTDSTFIKVSGTKLTLHYPQDSLPGLAETVTVTARQGEEVATDVFRVTLTALGSDLFLAPIPDLDVLEGEATPLDITPYIKNAPDIDEVVVTVKGSEHVKVEGRVLTFYYDLYFEPETEVVNVNIEYRDFGAFGTVTVRIHDAEDDFYLAEIPDVYVTETVPETFNIKQYIKNAHDINHITALTNHPYAEVNGFDIRLQYPEGFTGDGMTKDDLVRVTVTDGLHNYTRSVTVHVARLTKELALSGIGDRTVFQGDDLVVDLTAYLYNVDDWDAVTATIEPATYATQEGLKFILNYPLSVSFTFQEVTFTAREGEDVASETITVYIERVPTTFTFGPIGSITAIEDEPYVLDVEPYLKNMASGVGYEVGVHSDHATVEGFIVTFLYNVETPMDELVRINVTGENDDFAEQDVFVHVKTVNDPPVLKKAMAVNYNVVEGEDPVVINLVAHFSDVDTAKLYFSCDHDIVVIDNENGTASIVFEEGAAKPDNLVGVVIVAYDPDEPASKVSSNGFNVTFFTADEPGPGTGPGDDGPSVQDAGGGTGWLVVAIILVAAVAGAGWMYYRKRKPAVDI